MNSYRDKRLVTFFGDAPSITSELSLEEDKDVTRTAVCQVFDFVSEELIQKANALPVIQKEVGRITKGSALGIDAELCCIAIDIKSCCSWQTDNGSWTLPVISVI